MNFRMLTHNGFKIAVPVSGVRLVEQDPDSPTHAIITVDFGNGCPQRISIDEEFFVALSRLNTIAD